MFVTNQTFQGNLGGVAGGDELCQTAADSSVLTQGGIYKAWLSGTTADSSPSMRFTNLDKVGPYVRVDGEIVANDWDDLTTAKGNNFLRASISLTELGTVHGQTGTWTGTSTAGTPLSDTCDGWTTSDSGQGTIGNNLSLIIWTNVGTGGCPGSRPIYCFEQG